MKQQAGTKTSYQRALLLLIFGVAIAVLIGALAYQQMQIRNLKSDQADQVQMLYNTIDANAQANAVAVDAQNNRVYVPELHISLPYNDITKTLRYTYSDRDGARFYSTLVTDHAVHQISCYDMVRAKHEATPNAYSPGQPHVATVLAGTPPLQLYTESNTTCATQAWMQITPAQIADELKQAQSY
ncbi:MAG TPA: hypothetical protein VHT70_03745 [Candidatus Saccharimonadales bacterium]|jgi:hypothetical protein|nr:hypothetical protein [Candidatus Saccharimonadales bacterium]